jgi:hypothetical protein
MRAESSNQEIQMQIIGNGIQIGGIIFQCFEDVKIWVTSKFPIKCYGLYIDAVLILDFFSFVSHVDAEKSVSAVYNQQKLGFTRNQHLLNVPQRNQGLRYQE